MCRSKNAVAPCWGGPGVGKGSVGSGASPPPAAARRACSRRDTATRAVDAAGSWRTTGAGHKGWRAACARPRIVAPHRLQESAGGSASWVSRRKTWRGKASAGTRTDLRFRADDPLGDPPAKTLSGSLLSPCRPRARRQCVGGRGLSHGVLHSSGLAPSRDPLRCRR